VIDQPAPSDRDHAVPADPEDEVVWFEDDPRPVVAIDGPAGSGKSTVAGLVAEALDVPHVDTGALYRAATLACLRAGVDLGDGASCTSVVVNARIDRDDVAGRTYLDGEDVEDEIRGPEVTAAVSGSAPTTASAAP
jgi:cytidylate kinase